MHAPFRPLDVSVEAPAPIPDAFFRRWAIVFHALFFGGVILALTLRWSRQGFGWHPADIALATLVLAQTGIYLRFLRWPPTREREWVIHFLLGFGLWFTEWQIESTFAWLFLPYLGNLSGVLSPRLIQKLETAQRELESARQRESELIALRERERLARDFHDGLGNALVTLTVQLEAAQRILGTDAGQCRTLLRQLQTLTRATMDELRRSLANLRAPGLGDRSLASALTELVAEVGHRAQIVYECHVFEGADRLQPSVAEALWRVAQEGLTNVERHAGATRICLSLTALPNEVVLQINDNGVGMSSDDTAKPGHFGLRGLRERLEGLGGTFTTVEQRAGTGIEARIPVIGVS
jgi:signal transduction histidine kinase